VVCWSWICGLGSIEKGSLGPINTLLLDHKSGSPQSQLGLLPDINKLPLQQVSQLLTRHTVSSVLEEASGILSAEC